MFETFNDIIWSVLDRLTKEMNDLPKEVDKSHLPSLFAVIKTRLNSILFEHNEYLNMARVFTHLFGIQIKLGPNLIKAICLGSSKLARAFGGYYTFHKSFSSILKLKPFNEKFKQSVQSEIEFEFRLDRAYRDLIWFMGHYAFN